MNNLKLYLILSFGFIITGCFTGIESTPKITADNVRESGVRVTDEQTFAAQITPTPPRDWLPGKQWLVADPKIALVFTSASASSDSIFGKIIEFVETRNAMTVTGDEIIELVLKSENGSAFYHRTGVSPSDWMSRNSYAIPFTIELTSVNKADSLMKGHIYYITTPRWYDADGADFIGQRHIPVEVVGVRPGNSIYPLLVAFRQPNRPSEPVRYILMTYGNETSATRNFDRLFSFSDPRKSYPSITDATWDKIINSKLAEGMTRDEARLALGTPASIDRAALPGAQVERWSYENGVYLIFEDGILTRFRQ